MFKNKPHVILKKLSSTVAYCIYPISKDELNKIAASNVVLEEGMDIMAYGKSNGMDLVTAENVIPKKVYINNLLTGSTENTYRCWCCKVKGLEQFIGHKTVLNSWDCLIVSMGNPEYVVITRQTVDANADS